MALCEECIKGVTHEGSPSGQWQNIGGTDCYIATPDGDHPEDKVILFLSDVFGPQFANSQLLASDFAANGFKVIYRMIVVLPVKANRLNICQTVAIDYFRSDPTPAGILKPNYSGPPFDKNAWLVNHGPDQVRPLIDNVVRALKEDGVTRFGATGYCFGGRYTFDLAFENVIQVSVVSHPSRLRSPDDLEKYLQTSKAPLLINSCTNDSQFPHEAQAKADELLGNGKFVPGYKREYFEECTHGFAVRGDLSDSKAKAGKEGAFRAAVGWFKEYL